MKKYNKWTEKMCFDEALKFSNRRDFREISSRAYEILRKGGQLDIACKHMKKPYEDTFKWTEEKCRTVALKYQHRIEFQQGDKKAYESAKHNGWLENVCRHMKFKKLPNGHWNNVENCRNRALEYKTKTEFCKFSPHVYTISLKSGWLDDICQHMIPVGSKYKRCIYAYEFSDNHVYVGLTYNIVKRQYIRNSDERDSVTIHMKMTGLVPIRKQLTEYVSVENAIKLERETLNKYVSEGWIPLNRCKTGGIGGYTLQDLK
jgi:predicted GIY-YIG superfamily endonuclease